MKIIKIIILILLALIIIIASFINLSPEFGMNPSASQRKVYSTFSNYKDGEFTNDEKTELFTEKMTMSDFFKSDPNRIPKKDIPPLDIDFKIFRDQDMEKIKIAWLGHSGFIINIGGRIVLLDPMLGQYAAPLPMPSLKRYSSAVALSIADVDSIDAVVFSHDHYDHLDYPTIKKIKDKVKIFIVPHGVGNHLREWGISENSIIELNWEQSRTVNGIEFVCLPARHFSGRGPFNRNSTLWSSWAIKSKHGKIYFSGDSGYGTHFKKIGDQHGPFDITLIDCGQYNEAWKYSHMFPEQSILAARDLKGDYLIPIHWGAFTLSTHPWTEPPEIVLEKAGTMGQKIILPQIGQVISFIELEDTVNPWWRDYD